MARISSIAAGLLAFVFSPVFAADHRDGPLATGDPAADLNDVYTFVNPNDPEELIVILTMHPGADFGTRFSDAVDYRFHIDNGAANGTTLISCRFSDAGARVLCRGAGDTLYAEGRIEELIDADDLRVWAGLRDDPFFFDGPAFQRTRATLAPQFTNPGVNSFTTNTLTIALGINSDRLSNNGANPVLKVYASSARIDDFGISAGHSGAWYDPANSGHGVFIHTIAADPNDPQSQRLMVAHWAVFDNQGNQLNVYGAGPINDNSAVVSVITSRGGRFPPMTNPPTHTDFGTLTFNFTSCNQGTMAVAPLQGTGFAATTVNLTRLTSVEDLNCTLFSAGQIDRNGRPGINTALIDLLADTGLRDVYNRADNPATWAAQFQTEMANNLAALDTLDGVANPLVPPATLAGILVDDRLIVDVSKPNCTAYLAVELNIPGDCGGRTLIRDVIDDTLGAVVGPGVSDNVANDSVFLDDFPFVGPPL